MVAIVFAVVVDIAFVAVILLWPLFGKKVGVLLDNRLPMFRR